MCQCEEEEEEEEGVFLKFFPPTLSTLIADVAVLWLTATDKPGRKETEREKQVHRRRRRRRREVQS